MGAETEDTREGGATIAHLSTATLFSGEAAELAFDDLDVHFSEHLTDSLGGDSELLCKGETLGTGDRAFFGCDFQEFFLYLVGVVVHRIPLDNRSDMIIV